MGQGTDDYSLGMFQILQGLWPKAFDHKASYCYATLYYYTVIYDYYKSQ